MTSNVTGRVQLISGADLDGPHLGAGHNLASAATCFRLRPKPDIITAVAAQVTARRRQVRQSIDAAGNRPDHRPFRPLARGRIGVDP